MLQKKYSLFTTEESQFDQMCQSLLSQIVTETAVIKIVFFGLTKNNKEYFVQIQTLTHRVGEYFPLNPPLVSYVAQAPYKSKLVAEVVSIPLSVQNFSIRYGTNYIVLDNGLCRELISGGILPPDLSSSYEIQSDATFAQIKGILSHENFPLNSIVRQWNYIEKISMFKDGEQNYQEFNDSRSKFYAETTWEGGYPAATGIGTDAGGVMIEFIAFAGINIVNKPLDNPLQIAAHNYSQSVLHGGSDLYYNPHSTPKFERARIVGFNNLRTIYISGTAAIRGEASVFEDSITDQAWITMENIENLLSAANCPVEEIQMCRIYVKNIAQMEEVSAYLTENFPGIKPLLVNADICRDELLLEIEGVAMMIY